MADEVMKTTERERLKRLVETRGQVGAAKVLGVSRAALAGAIAGLNIRAGTAALIRQRLQTV